MCINTALKRIIRRELLSRECDRGIYVVRLLNKDNGYYFNIVVEYGLQFDGDEPHEYVDIYQGRLEGEYKGSYEFVNIVGLQEVIL